MFFQGADDLDISGIDTRNEDDAEDLNIDDAEEEKVVEEEVIKNDSSEPRTPLEVEQHYAEVEVVHKGSTDSD